MICVENENRVQFFSENGSTLFCYLGHVASLEEHGRPRDQKLNSGRDFEIHPADVTRLLDQLRDARVPVHVQRVVRGKTHEDRAPQRLLDRTKLCKTSHMNRVGRVNWTIVG